MRLDVTCMRYMSKDEFRVLTAVEVRSLVLCVRVGSDGVGLHRMGAVVGCMCVRHVDPITRPTHLDRTTTHG